MSQPTFSPPYSSHGEVAWTSRSPIPGIMLLADERADMPVVSAMHPLLRQNAVTAITQASGVSSFTKSLSYLYFLLK